MFLRTPSSILESLAGACFITIQAEKNLSFDFGEKITADEKQNKRDGN